MSNVNIEGFVEVECPILNEEKMKSFGFSVENGVKELNHSPGLKVQLFLNKHDAKEIKEGASADYCTNIICDRLIRRGRDSGKCKYRINDQDENCLYNQLSTDKK